MGQNAQMTCRASYLAPSQKPKVKGVMNHSTYPLANGTTRVKDRAECKAPMDQTQGRTLLSLLGLVAIGVLVLRWATT